MKTILKNIVANLPVRFQTAALASIERLQLVKSGIACWIAQWRYAPSDITKKYFHYNRQKINNRLGQRPEMILIDCFPVPQWVIANSIFLNALGEKLGASIASYGFFPRHPEVDSVYRSFGAERHLQLTMTASQRARRYALYREIISRIKTSDDLFNWHIDGIWLGLDIYETILRQGSKTVDLDSYETKFHIYHGLRYFIYFYDLIRSGSVKAVAPSHDCYLQMGTLVKIACRFKIPVYYANPFELIRSSADHDIYLKFMDYPKYFAALGAEEQAVRLARAKEALSQRLGGVIGMDMSYQVESAFTQGDIARQTSTGNKLKVLVATHCFFDNPHAYSKMTYRDFYQWMEFLGAMSDKTDYDWYIKPHRDYLPGTMEVLQEFVVKYPKFKLIDPATTFHQLKREGVSIALSCYGSIGHELPLLGYRVINATYNPHNAYHFNTHCYSPEEYERILINLETLPPAEDIEKIYEFYAVHYRLVKSDALLFDSFDDYQKYIGVEGKGEKGYAFFMRDPDRYASRYRQRVDAFLASDCHYEFELRLPNWTAESSRRDSAPNRHMQNRWSANG